MTASYASGQLVFLPALAWLAGFDWRWAALAIALVAVLLVLPVVLRFMRDRPEDVGLTPYGADGLGSWADPHPHRRVHRRLLAAGALALVAAAAVLLIRSARSVPPVTAPVM